jgi:hypothetical protein
VAHLLNTDQSRILRGPVILLTVLFSGNYDSDHMDVVKRFIGEA